MITQVLWCAFGMTIGAAVLHAALGLPRPVDRTRLSFACLMMMLAGYVFLEDALYRVTTSAEAVETIRYQVITGHGLIASMLIFVPAYTQVRIPRGVAIAYWAGMLALFVTNLVAPYSVWFSGPPHLEPAMVGGTPYLAVVAPPPSLLQYIHAFYVVCVFGLTFACAVAQMRRGEWRRGSTLAISLLIVILYAVADILRDWVSGTWPYLNEFGFLTWGLIMSVQLAVDYRIARQRLRTTLRTSEQHAAELARTVEAALRIRDKLNTPLQTLELSLSVRTPRTSEDEPTLEGLRDAVTQISDLSRAVERATDHGGALAALERLS